MSVKLITVLLAGDIELNPGPSWRYPCGECSGPVKCNQKGIFCDVCNTWLHTHCIGLSDLDYSILQASPDTWACRSCLCNTLPFHNASLGYNSNTSISDLSISSTSTSAPNENLNIVSLNCRSLLSKIDNLRLLTEAQNPHVVALCETWLDDSISDRELSCEGYFLVRRDRNRQGGGTAAYIREDVPFTIHTSHSSIEFLMLNLKLASGSLLCGIFYRPPSSKAAVLSELEATLESLPPVKLVLLGDFNIDITNSKDPYLHHIQSISDKLSLKQVVSSPTRSTTSSSSIIDHIYLTDNPKLLSCEVGPPLDGCDHNTIFVSLDMSPQKVLKLLAGNFGYTRKQTSSLPTKLLGIFPQAPSQILMLTSFGLPGSMYSWQLCPSSYLQNDLPPKKNCRI
ncbi:uncharacterized protein LOC135331318 [Halichondria panicea]|uniref:uncharacterized protein LOC135331318 n=1 Tax=Halichondria panicea TaxID=6063 RepID=UPI00312B354D